MKTQYVYVNYYTNGYLYVGSHTWDGPEGVLDPNYHGSSHVAAYYKWDIDRVKLLEVVTEERRYIAEREWIEKYAEKYGIADCALFLDQGKNIVWTSKFRCGGRLINLHAQSAESATFWAARKVKENGLSEKQKAHAKKQIRKILSLEKTERQREAFAKNIKKAQDASVKKIKEQGLSERQAAHARASIAIARESFNEEVYKKRATTRVKNMRENGTFGNMSQCHTEESLKKSVQTRLESGALRRFISSAFTEESLRKRSVSRVSSARKCRLSDGFIGNRHQIKEHLNVSLAYVSKCMSAAYKDGSYNAKFVGVIFYKA